MAQPSIVILGARLRAVGAAASRSVWGQDRYIVQYRIGNVGTGVTTASCTFTVEHTTLTTDLVLKLNQEIVPGGGDITLTYPTPGMAGMGAPNPITDAQITIVNGWAAFPAAMISGATLPVTLTSTTPNGLFYITGPLRRVRCRVTAYTPASNGDDTGLFMELIGKE